MVMYSIGVYPLISLLKDQKHYKQNWYTDDSACAGSLLCIREWLLQLLRLGPSYGYFAEPSKSIIVVIEEHFQEAQDVFADLEVEVVLVGRFLGSCIGNDEGIRQYVQGKVDLWVGGVEQLAEVARRIHSLLIVPSLTLYLVSGRISSVSLKAMTKNTSACVMLFSTCSLQLCWEEKSWRESMNCSLYLLS